MAEQSLVLFDADRIKDYVFATGRLKEIRGASAIVQSLTDPAPIQRLYAQQFDGRRLLGWTESHTDADDRLIYAGGGAGALLFADGGRAGRFCTALERHYHRETRVATLSAVAVPIGDSPADAQKRAAVALARRKQSRPVAEAVPGGGAIRFCASDRLRPASISSAGADGDSALVSQATYRKQQASRRERRRQEIQADDYWRMFERSLPSDDIADWRAAINPGQDLGDIAAHARPQGYVALVYADGDGVGQLLRRTVERYGFDGYWKLSQALHHGTTTAVGQALAAAYGANPPLSALPFEVVTVGGDDVLLICTADHGLAIASALSSEIGRAAHMWLDAQREPIELPHRLSASVGVVICHDSLPIVQLERRGRELLKSAKKVKDPQAGIGGVDFHIVSSPVLAEIAAVRAMDYRPETMTELTKRPYPGRLAEILLRQARCLRSLLPGSKRADLYNACQGARVWATLAVLSVHARLDAAARLALLEALDSLGSVQVYPFDHAKGGKPHRTALLDLLEVIEFVAEEGRWAN